MIHDARRYEMMIFEKRFIVWVLMVLLLLFNIMIESTLLLTRDSISLVIFGRKKKMSEYKIILQMNSMEQVY